MSGRLSEVSHFIPTPVEHTMGPYLIAFALFCGLLCYGLMKRPTWMWYAGWILFYLFAGYFNLFFFSALFEAQNNGELLHSCLYLVGGLIFWLPAVVWWCRIRHSFGAAKGKPERERPPFPEP